MAVRSIIKNADKRAQTQEQIDQRYKDNDPNDEWYKAEDADVARLNGLLEKYKTTDDIVKYGTGRVVAWGKSTLTLKKEIAAAIVALRKQHTSTQGNFPDWDGRTGDYKAAKKKMMRDSGLSQQDLDAIESAVRYHVQNLVVKVAPKKQLETLNMLTTSRRERQNQRQQGGQNEEADIVETPAPIVVAGVEVQPPELKENQAEAGLTAARDIMHGVLKSKDLTKVNKDKVIELIEEIQATTVKIGDAISEATEKANKRREQAAQRRAAAADAA